MNTWGFRAGHRLFPQVFNCSPVLRLVNNPSGTGPEDASGCRGTCIPCSWHWAEVPSTSPFTPLSSYQSVKASRVGQGLGMVKDMIRAQERMAGPDALSPEPFQALVLYSSAYVGWVRLR